MRHAQIFTKTYIDDSGRSIDLPTILIENNGEKQVLEQLYKYQLKNHAKSRAWHIKLVEAVDLLLDYMESNQENYTSANDFFKTFSKSVSSGTINENGSDPSGLYWLPKRIETANMLISALNGFAVWLYNEYGAVQLNPWKESTRYEERLNWMAQINNSHHLFLGHLDDVYEMSETVKKARNIVERIKV